MRILIFSAYYRPDGGPAAPLFTMLAEELVRRGHALTVVTAAPHYPSGKVPAQYRGWWPKASLENGVRVIRVPLPSLDRRRMPLRLTQFGAYQSWAFFQSLVRSCDVVVAHSPALEVWLPFITTAVARRKPSVYSVHDVYPDQGVKLGIFKNRLVIAAVKWLERSCLRRCTRVRILSDSFAAPLAAHGVPEEKMRLIYDWVEIDGLKPAAKDNAFAAEYGLRESLNIVYAGNMGVIQGLETALEAASLLHDLPAARFVFIGDGSEKPRLSQWAAERQLGNVVFLPYQPRQRMGEIWGSADAALVMLKRGTGFGALPSKTFSILASGRPVLASVDEGSDSWRLVERSRSGICVPPESPVLLAQAVRELAGNAQRRREYGEAGRAYVVDHHSPQAAATQFEQLFNEAIHDASAHTRRNGHARA